jgi:predicted DNA-binding transcriptional regulator YafY
MVHLTKEEAETIVGELSESSNKKVKEIVKKLKSPEKRTIYIKEKKEINQLLKKAFKERRQVKIRYYSPHSDENTTRIINIYQIHGDCITTFCHLREEERVFRVDRIGSATILDKKYKIPKGWKSENIILD